LGWLNPLGIYPPIFPPIFNIIDSEHLIQSSPFEAWIEGALQSFWIYGGPGSGKTCLCMNAIDHVQTLCQSDPAKRCAYFYFGLNDLEEDPLYVMLGSIIGQLCLQISPFPESLRNLYSLSGKGQLPAKKEALVKLLISLLITSTFERTYLFLDGLEECRERGELFELINKILQTDVALLMTSRKEPDIKDILQGSADCAFDINDLSRTTNPDISTYIRKQVESFEQWPHEVKLEVRETLVKQSRGRYLSFWY
jgi:hypothetical protein